MKFNKWTLALAGAGVVSLASVAQAEEAQMSQVLTAVSSTTLSGYVDTSAIWKFGTGNGGLAPGGVMPGRAFDNTSKMDGFNLNVVGVNLEKPLSEDQWAAGYKVGLLFGPDATGFNTSANAVGISDFTVKEAYVALRMPIGNGIDWKIGTFNTIIGYESFESYLNPNYSRSFGWQLEPTQHTGVLASYKVTDAVSFSAGLANTWSAGINARSTRAESHKAYMASITVTAPESMGFLKGSAWYAGVVDGFAGNTTSTGAGNKDTASVYMGGTLATPVEGLSVGGAFDYRFNGANAVTPGSNWAYAIAGYGSYQASEKWKLNARIDYTTGSDGTWFNAGVVGAGTGVSDKQNMLGSFTLTADYALWANVISRAELRWDHSLTGDRPYGISDRNAFTLAANVVYKF